MILRIVFKAIEKHYPHLIPQYRKFFPKNIGGQNTIRTHFAIKRKYILKFIYSILRIYKKHNYVIGNRKLISRESWIKKIKLKKEV
ncbi:hypothetical protein LEP1GSC188_2724 [Leptospira weilii serovar Topaz str. LT2116]|uniref:Uncharacterized protein n=1 Tax=Leptospira weilii serovar Topaz str. LT2116 TaxID=1088540 RepID=M3GWF9_9LEPT|nr:hypothetical protein LEP1GSC188_2724 [Leptospira weilii serovar Topaz str. LT2116]